MLTNWRIKSKLDTHIRVLLFANSGFIKLVLRLKSEWLTKAVGSVNRGEKVGDVAALVILDQIQYALINNEDAKRELLKDFEHQTPLNDLKSGNSIVVWMMCIIHVLKSDDFSNSLDYLVCNSYSQLLSSDKLEREAISYKIMNYSLLAHQSMSKVWGDSKKPKIGIDDSFSVVTKHLSVVQAKITSFVETEYEALTSDLLKSYEDEVVGIDVSSAHSMVKLSEITEVVKEEVLKLNDWAWEQAKRLIKDDIDLLDKLLVGTHGDHTAAGERLADIVETTVENHTRSLLDKLGAIRKRRLAQIEQG